MVLMDVCAMLLQPSFKRAAWLTDILHHCALFSVQVVAYPPPLCTSGGKTLEKKPNHGPVSIIPTKALPSAAAASGGMLLPFKPSIFAIIIIHVIMLQSIISRPIWCLCILSLLLPDARTSSRPVSCALVKSFNFLKSCHFCGSIFSPSGRLTCPVL